MPERCPGTNDAPGNSLTVGSQRWIRSVAACSATVDTVADLANPPMAGGQSRAMKFSARGSYVLDIVIPLYNEEREVADSVRRLHRFLAAEVPYAARITLADNPSTDGTLDIATRLANEFADVEVLHLDVKGRGGALRAAWAASTAAVVAYWTSTCRPTSRR